MEMFWMLRQRESFVGQVFVRGICLETETFRFACLYLNNYVANCDVSIILFTIQT